MSTFPPIHKTLELPRSASTCFEHFAAIGTWWPLDSHAIGDRVVGAAIEPHVGGRVYERWADGTEHEWGRVTAYDPYERLAFTFVAGQTGTPESVVEVRFSPLSPTRTRVELEHRDWDKLESAAPGIRGRYDGGWDYVLGKRYAEALSTT